MYNQKDRIEPRQKVCLRGRLHGSGFDRDVCVLDASTRGMLLTLSQPPKAGQIVELFVNGHALLCEVEWSNGRRMGVKLHERIDVFRFISGESGPIQLRGKTMAHRKATPVMVADFNQYLVRKVQLVLGLAAIAAAGWLVFGLAGNSLGSLDRITHLLAAR